MKTKCRILLLFILWNYAFYMLISLQSSQNSYVVPNVFISTDKEEEDSDPNKTLLFCSPSSKINNCLCYLDDASISEPSASGQNLTIFSNTAGIFKSLKCALTVYTNGRLGNQMGAYATMYGLAKLNKRPALVPPEAAALLRKYFKISLPVMPPDVKQFFEDENNLAYKGWVRDWMEPKYANLSGLFVHLTGYPCSWTFYDHVRDEILKEFTFHDHIVAHAQSRLRAIRQDAPVYVGVHVRRGDYIGLMANLYNGTLADSEFFQKAFHYFRSKYNNTAFLVVSDDMDWCRQNIENARDVHFVGTNDVHSPIDDMALLANCNHSVITFSTYGYWGAYLAGGEVVHITNFTWPQSTLLKVMKYEKTFLPDWIGIAANLHKGPKEQHDP